MINRLIADKLIEKSGKNKAIIVLGPRQVGKSTLLEKVKADKYKNSLFLNCDLLEVRQLITNPTLQQIKRLIGNANAVFIDEAQRVENIGLTLKIIIDELKIDHLWVSGSSSLDLSDKINEPLTGRKLEYNLFPFSIKELSDHFGFFEVNNSLHDYILYGMYPDVINNKGEEEEILQNLTSSYLFKDVFSNLDMRKPELIEKLVEALALQVGSEISYSELSKLLGVSSQTIQKYILLLEKAFIIFRLRSFSRNARNELKKSRKIYFYDNGIRNAIIGNFSPLDKRTDIGQLWENFVISERLKYLKYGGEYSKQYFWRTTQQQEIDYIEEKNGELFAFEIKWNTNRKVKFSKTFLNNYPNSKTEIITMDNIWDFVGL